MSGGVLGIAGLIGGAFIACGQVAAGTATIAVQGGIAAYEQFEIAKDCQKAVQALEKEIQSTMNVYRSDADKVLAQATQAEYSEIIRFKNELRKKGASQSELNVTGSTEEILIELLKINERYNNRTSIHVTQRAVSAQSTVQKTSVTRTPKHIYENIVGIIIPLKARCEENSNLNRLLTRELRSAASILNGTEQFAEKVASLKQIEEFIITKYDEYDAIIKSNRILKEEYIGLKIASEKLATIVGTHVNIEDFQLETAQKQITELKTLCEDLRSKAREKLLQDENAIAANRKMAELIIEAIENAGHKKVAVNDKAYGVVSVHKFGNSFIKAVTNKDGNVAISICGNEDENDVRIKKDELHFCRTSLQNIIDEMNNLGIEFDITSREFLNSENIVRLSITDIEDSEDGSETTRRRRINADTLYA